MITKVLVTGAHSQLGKTIKELYSTNEDEIQFTFTTRAELDITTKDKVEAFFSKNNFDYCINCAAYTDVDQAEIDTKSAFKVNAEGVKRLAQICKNTNTVLIHISTDYVFDGSKKEPYTELDTPNPINEYGKSKLLGEQYIQEILQKYFIIRTSWLYSKYENNFIKTMIRLSKERNELDVVSDQIGTPTFANDLAEVILNFIKIKTNKFGIYNYSSEGRTNWYDFAKAIFEFLKIKIKVHPIKAKDYSIPLKRPNFSVLDKTKINQLLDINIPYWKDGLKKAISNL
jgi:dTDP-4-dehydrorhamnose reductase